MRKIILALSILFVQFALFTPAVAQHYTASSNKAQVNAKAVSDSLTIKIYSPNGDFVKQISRSEFNKITPSDIASMEVDKIKNEIKIVLDDLKVKIYNKKGRLVRTTTKRLLHKIAPEDITSMEIDKAQNQIKIILNK